MPHKPKSEATQAVWYCRISGNVQGPFTGARLRQMASAGRLAAADEVRNGEAGRWVRAKKVNGLHFRSSEGEGVTANSVARESAASAGRDEQPWWARSDEQRQEPEPERIDPWRSVVEPASTDSPVPRRRKEAREESWLVKGGLWLIGGIAVVAIGVVVLFITFRSQTQPVIASKPEGRQVARNDTQKESQDKQERDKEERIKQEQDKLERDKQERIKQERDKEERIKQEREKLERDKQKRPPKPPDKKPDDPVFAPPDPTHYLRVEFSEDNQFGLHLPDDPTKAPRPDRAVVRRIRGEADFKEDRRRPIKRLTFSTNGGTNNACLAFDGQVMPFNGGQGRPQTYKDGPNLGWKCSQTYPGKIEVTQDVSVRRGDPSLKFDTCLVRYTLKNLDTKPHKIGLRFLLDTLIGGNDGVPFTIPGRQGLCSTCFHCPKAEDMPDFIQVLEKPDLKQPGVVAHLGLRLSGSVANVESPDRLVLTEWPGQAALRRLGAELKRMERTGALRSRPLNFNDVSAWYVNPVSFANSKDSAVVLYWVAKDIPAGESRHVGFTYGLGSVASNEGGGSLALTVGGSFRQGGQFTVTAYVKDGKQGEEVTLQLPEGLQVVDSEKTPLRRFVPFDEKAPITQVSWKVKGTKSGKQKIAAKLNNGATQTQEVVIDPANLDSSPR